MRRLLAYQPSLDGVRACAVLAVIASHTSASITAGGSLGVDVFFVLSGFLITTLLLREWEDTGTIDLRAFYVRRLRRLMPALVLVVVSTALVYGIFSVGGAAYARSTVVQVPEALFYAISWISAFNLRPPGALTHTWSLSVEEHFYVLWPPLLLVAARRGTRAARRLAIGAFSASAVYAVSLGIADRFQQRLYFAPDTRFHAIACGCVLAVVLPLIPERARSLRIDVVFTAAMAFVAIMMLVTRFNTLAYYMGLNVALDIAVAVIIAYLMRYAHAPAAQVLGSRPMVWIGKRSYSIYLWQVPVIVLFNNKLHDLHAMRVVLAIFVTFGLSAFSYRFVELPFQASRTRVERGEPEAGGFDASAIRRPDELVGAAAEES
jgi:peptidoglycan/LPS O-acetylase OafA/YrhL